MGQFTSITGKLDRNRSSTLTTMGNSTVWSEQSFDAQAKDALKSLQWSRQDMEDLVLCCHNDGGCT
jgi:hypothetical protein